MACAANLRRIGCCDQMTGLCRRVRIGADSSVIEGTIVHLVMAVMCSVKDKALYNIEAASSLTWGPSNR